MEQELLRHGKRIVNCIRKEYEQMVAEGVDAPEAEQNAIEGWLTTNYDVLAVIWAAGVVSEAYDAVYKEVESHLFDGYYE